MSTGVFFLLYAQNGQLADSEEIFAAFDQMCIKLEMMTTPLSGLKQRVSTVFTSLYCAWLEMTPLLLYRVNSHPTASAPH